MTAYLRPSYSALLARIQSDLDALPAVLRDPLAASWARVGNGMHGHLDWIAQQCSPLTCELERLYDWAALYGVERLLATAASGTALAFGVTGTQLLAGTVLRGQNGLDYSVLSAVMLGPGPNPVAVRCDTAGAGGNLIAGQLLALVDPVPGVIGSLMVADITGGAEDEPVDDWRARVAEEWSTVTTLGARSGKPDDYRFWARRAHPSVSGAIVQPHMLGIGTVVVRPVCNDLNDRLPTQAVLDAVSEYLETMVPATADWRVSAPNIYPVTLSIHLLPVADTAENRAAITAALDALVLSRGGIAGDTLQLLWAEVHMAISIITMQYSLLEAGSIAWAADEVPVLQPVSWI